MRIIIRCSGLLLPGAALTVVGAWGPAVWYDVRGGYYRVEWSPPTAEQVRWWNATVTPGVDDGPFAVSRPPQFVLGFDEENMGATASEKSMRGAYAYRLRGGLPLRSLGYFSWSASGESIDRSDWHSTWASTIPVQFNGRRGAVTLPLTPLWPGFVIDTLFFAAVSWLVLGGWRWMVRRRRLNRGRCPACRYPIGSSAVCTECGEAVPAFAAH